MLLIILFRNLFQDTAMSQIQKDEQMTGLPAERRGPLRAARLFAIVLVALVGGLGWRILNPSSSVVPVQLEKLEVGIVWAGTHVRHPIAIRNESDRSLEINHFWTSCTCTTSSQVIGRKILAREIFMLPVDIRIPNDLVTANNEDNATVKKPISPVDWSVPLEIGMLEGPLAKGVLEARVLPLPIRFVESFIGLPSVDMNDSDSAAALELESRIPLESAQVEIDHDAIRCELVRQSDDPCRFALEFRCSTRLQGDKEVNVSMTCLFQGFEDLPCRLQIPVLLNFPRFARAFPDELNFGILARTDTRTLEMSIETENPAEISVHGELPAGMRIDKVRSGEKTSVFRISVDASSAPCLPEMIAFHIDAGSSANPSLLEVPVAGWLDASPPLGESQ